MSAQGALDLAVGALLHVVGAQALPMARREVEVGERIGLCLLEDRGRIGAAFLEHLDGNVVGGPHGAGLLEPEHGRHDLGYAAGGLLRAGGAYAVAHEVDAPAHGAARGRPRALRHALAGVRAGTRHGGEGDAEAV